MTDFDFSEYDWRRPLGDSGSGVYYRLLIDLEIQSFSNTNEWAKTK